MNSHLRFLKGLGHLIIITFLLSACSPQIPEPASSEESSSVPSDITPPAPTDSSQNENSLPVEPHATPIVSPTSGAEKPIGAGTPTGAVPGKLMKTILEDLVGRTGAVLSSIEVKRADAVVWSDGSLGCPEPGMMYTQALVNGYWVVLNVGGRDYDYRASQGGNFRLCEGKGQGPYLGTPGEPGPSPDS